MGVDGVGVGGSVFSLAGVAVVVLCFLLGFFYHKVSSDKKKSYKFKANLVRRGFGFLLAFGYALWILRRSLGSLILRWR